MDSTSSESAGHSPPPSDSEPESDNGSSDSDEQFWRDPQARLITLDPTGFRLKEKLQPLLDAVDLLGTHSGNYIYSMDINFY